MSLTLIELLGLGGFVLGILNIALLWAKHRRNKPLIKIEKNIYKMHLKYGWLPPKEYVKKLEEGELNDADKIRVRELVLNITNKGYRDARLKSVLPLYRQEGRNDFSPRVINFHPTTINAGDREEIHLFFEFPTHIIEEIEKKLPHTIKIIFDFAHNKIKKNFTIGKNK